MGGNAIPAGGGFDDGRQDSYRGRRMASQAWLLLVFPWITGLWGLLLMLNIFGRARREANFYKGRGYWHPILDGEDPGTHRLMGAILFAFAVFATWMMASQGVL